jgi:hypothetical protein
LFKNAGQTVYKKHPWFSSRANVDGLPLQIVYKLKQDNLCYKEAFKRKQDYYFQILFERWKNRDLSLIPEKK